MMILNSASEFLPDSFTSIDKFPERLYTRGRLELLRREPKLALIGSRKPTPYGVRMARQIATDLASAGIIIVSGLAMGIDGIVHRAAVEAGGDTIAVLGTAIDQLYPKCNRDIAEHLVAEHLVLSELAPGTPGRPWYFTERNRLISGLSRAVVIIEATAKSGTLSTARWALDQGRELFVLPGPADSEQSAGTLQLLRDGARCVRSAADILEDLNLIQAGRQLDIDVSHCNEKETNDPVLGQLGSEPVHFENLLEKLALSAAELSPLLLELELIGRIRQLPGQRYVRS